MIRRPPRSTLFPTRRSSDLAVAVRILHDHPDRLAEGEIGQGLPGAVAVGLAGLRRIDLGQAHPGLTSRLDRKSTRLNSSHANISYAVFCLKKKNTHAHSFIC